MRMGSRLSVGGFMLALAVMLTQARFIAKRETTLLDQAAVASTSISADPDIVTQARESGNVGLLHEAKGEGSGDFLGAKTGLVNEAVTPTDSLKPTVEGFSVVSSSTDAILEKEQLKQKEEKTLDTQLEKETVERFKDKEILAQAATENSTIHLENHSAKLKDNQESETPSSTTIKHIELQEAEARESLPKEISSPKESEIPEKTTASPASSTTENLLMRPATLGISSTTERALNTTTRSSDHGRAMQYSSTTEAIKSLSPVTPMKLRALPMTSTTGKTTSTRAPSTSTPSTFASNENAIEESTSESVPGIRQLPEKRAKFISENSTNAQQLTLPNTAEVWSLAGMKAVPKAAPLPLLNHTDLANDIDESVPQNRTDQQHQVKEKNLLDWQQIAMMENRTEFVVRTTLDATEGATQATTEPLDEESYPKSGITQGLGGNTMGVTPSAGEGGFPDEKPTTTTARTEFLEVPMVKKMSDMNNSKLTDALNQRESTTEALINIPLTVQPSTAAVTARVALTKTELLNVTSGEMSALVNATTEEVETEGHTLAETDSEAAAAAVSEAVTRAIITTTTAKPAQEVVTVREVTATFAAKEETSATKPIATSRAAEATTAATEATTAATAAASAATEATSEATAATSAATLETPSTAAIPLATSSVTPETPVVTTISTTEMAMKASPVNVSNTSNTNNKETEAYIASNSSSESTNTSEAYEAVNNNSSESSRNTNNKNIIAYEVDNNSNYVIVATTNRPESEQRETASTVVKATATATAAPPAEATASSVSEKLTGGEVSSTSTKRPESVTGSSAIPIASTITGTSTSTSTIATPTPTEVAQISNEVNLEAVTVKSVHENGKDLGLSNANGPITAEKTDNAVNNSVAITESEPASPSSTTTTTTTTGSPLSDLGKLSQEHESSLETNNIGESPESTTAAATSTTDESTAAAAAGSATGGQQVGVPLHNEGQQVAEEEQDTEQQIAHTTMAVVTRTSTTTETPSTSTSTSTTMQPPMISLLDDSTTTTTTTTTTTAAPATEEYSESPSLSSSTESNMLPLDTTTTTHLPPPTFMAPYPNELDHMQTNAQGNGTDVNVIIATTVSVIGVVALILLVAFLYLMRKRQKQTSYGQRCRPVSLDAYSLDNVSVLGSVRRKGRDVRASKRTYGNAAFDDPSLRHNLLTAGELAKFVERRSDVFEEFRDVPQIIARADEVPHGCEDKNRYANVIPLPETRVVLQRQGDDDKTEYINANYVRGPRDAPNYYIACQAPLESTTSDFWRMIWEQQSRVIIQATDLSENGIEKCAEYLPPSATLDNHSSYGDYQVTLKHREVKDRYAISTLVLKRVDGEESRELTHYWYKWPEAGVPAEEAPIIAMLLEARSSLKSYCLEQANELREKSATLETSLDADGGGAKSEAGSTSSNEINGNISSRSAARNQQGPLTVHCSPGTGRTGTIIASDMAIRSLETPKRSVDIPQLVYYVRRGRASAVQTKEQYEFIYKVASMYAAKITNLSNDN